MRAFLARWAAVPADGRVLTAAWACGLPVCAVRVLAGQAAGIAAGAVGVLVFVGLVVVAVRWNSWLLGCCECGTGGSRPGQALTRYLYVGATAARAAQMDWAACSAHPLPGRFAAVDYGTDVAVPLGRGRVDAARMLHASPVEPKGEIRDV